MKKMHSTHATSFQMLLYLLMFALLLCCRGNRAAADEYEDGAECPFCGHYHWGDYLCGGCGGCSENCSNSDCYESTHCAVCGMCLALSDGCAEFLICSDCIEAEGTHCSICWSCHCDDFDMGGLCNDCYGCEGCVGMICEECGMCASCWEHCERCQGCIAHIGDCPDGGEHCEECCEFCDQCDRCLIWLEEDEGVPICDYCGLCEECCLANSEEEGCSCGLCIESSDWDEHICEGCDALFCNEDRCDYCGLCLDCCEDNSECSDGMCVEDLEYEEHFCEICGNCFHEVDLCESCYDAGYLICEDCCAEMAAFAGCDCTEPMCIHDDDFEDHLEEQHTDHPDGAHEASGVKAWSYDDDHHWHVCKNCDEEAHYTDLSAHHFNQMGRCVECGYQNGGAIYLTKSPKNVSCEVSDVNAGDDEPLSMRNNLVSFYVRAYGSGELTFTWYQNLDDGLSIRMLTEEDGDRICQIEYGEFGNSSTLTVSVSTEACCRKFGYYCVISDENGNTVTSSIGYIKAKHVYSLYQPCEGGEKKIFHTQSDVTQYYTESKYHQQMCCGEGCGKTRSAKIAHTYGAAAEVTDYSGEIWQHSVCIYCNQSRYIQQHEHSFTFDITPGDAVYNSAMKRYEGHLEDGRRYFVGQWYHAVSCDYEGCTVMRQEVHQWSQWQVVDTVDSKKDTGAVYRECLCCGYQQDSVKDENNKDIVWKYGIHPVTVNHGSANKSMVADEESLRLTYQGDGKSKCTGWTCLQDDTKPLKLDYADEGEAGWVVKIPKLGDASMLTFTPVTAVCDHSCGTKLIGQKEAICLREGYTGDEVCRNCGAYIKDGHAIPAPGSHSGTLTLIEGSARAGSCTERAYEGDRCCSACGEKVKGKSSGYTHEGVFYGKKEATFLEEGYTGDRFCIKCGKQLSQGEVIPRLNVADYVFITNQTPFSYQPYPCAVGDVITASFDAVLSDKLAGQGYTITAMIAYHVGTKAEIGLADAQNHCAVEIDFTQKGDWHLFCEVHLFDPQNNQVGVVFTEMTFRCSESSCQHSFTLISDTATCQKAGTRYYRCEKCGKAKTVTSPANDHHFFQENYSADEKNCYRKCIYCGARTDSAAHDYEKIKEVEINCTTADVSYRCKRCGCEKTIRFDDRNNHEYNINAGTYKNETHHWQYCIKCGQIRMEPHSFDSYGDCTNLQCLYHQGDLLNAKKNGNSYLVLPPLTCVHDVLTVDISHVDASLMTGSELVWYAFTSNGVWELGKGTTLDLRKLTTEQKTQLSGGTIEVWLQQGEWTILLEAEAKVPLQVQVAGVAATCSNTGVMAHYVCSCGRTCDQNHNPINPTIPATGQHSYDNDCDISCNVCGALREALHSFDGPMISDINGHYRCCTVCGAIGEAAPHEAGSWIIDKEAGCTEQGTRHKECIFCHYLLLSETTANAHQYVGTEIKAGCETEGSRTWTCEKCGDVITQTVVPLGHVLSAAAEKQATCMEEGCKSHYRCLVCGAAFADAEGKTPVQADSLALAKDPQNHVGLLYYGSDAKNHWGICRCGAVVSEKELHHFEDGKCTVCRLTKEEATAKEAAEPGTDPEKKGCSLLWLWILLAVLAVAGVTVVLIRIRKKDDRTTGDGSQ